MSKEVVLITGASSALGCEIMRRISSINTLILAHYNNSQDRLEAIIPCLASEVVPVKADFTDEESTYGLIKFITDNKLSPDKIVHLAAPKLVMKQFKKTQWNDFLLNLEVQLRSAVILFREFLPAMVSKKTGKVVVVLSSVTFGRPPNAMDSYVAAKFALLGLTRTLASEYAAKGININAVSPSMMKTGFLSEIPEKIIEITAEQNPLKRNAVPGDVAPLVKFLLSEEANFINGANISVSGGSIY